MNKLQKAGSFAAFATGVLFIAVNVFFLIVMPMLGTTDFSAIRDPKKVFPILNENPWLVEFNLIDLVLPVLMFVALFALASRLRDDGGKWSAIAQVIVIVPPALILTVGFVRYVGLGHLLSLHADEPRIVETTYVGFQLVAEGVNMAAVIALGLCLLTLSLDVLHSGRFPMAFAWLTVVLGVVHVLAFVLPLPPILDVIWFLWLGICLRRSNDAGEANQT